MTGTRLAGALVLGVAALAATPSTSARAQQVDPKTVAQQLFEEGRREFANGDCALAVHLFRRSQAAHPARGTLLNMAECEAELGRVASAWQHFTELLGQLARGDARIALTRQKLDALKPRVPWLIVELAPGVPTPTALLLDNTPLAADRVGVELPVDPGDHVLFATWSGTEAQELRVSMAEGTRRVVHLAPPGREPPPAVVSPAPVPPAAPKATVSTAPVAPSTPDSPPIDRPTGRRTLGFVVGGIGVAAVGVSAVTGILAIGTKSDLEAACPVQKPCGQEGLDLASKGQTLTTTSTVTFFVGVAALGTGIALVLTAPGAPRSAALAPAVLPGGGGALLSGRF